MMTARELIAHDIPALTVEHTGRDAFHFLGDFHVKHLPVVDGQRLIGVVSEEDIFNHRLGDPISEYDFSLMRQFAAREDDHIFEVMRSMGNHRLTVMPVVNAEGLYLGLITQNDLLRYFAELSSLTQHGAVLVLEMPFRDYSMATISRLVEEEDVRILGAFITAQTDDTLQLTLKLNRHDLGGVISALERHGYFVRQSFSEVEHSDILRERYDSLMNYLNI
ncbi:MAG: CBS domain-containing protein [Saprospiraceae bacterium]|nr:CBS domain-containing protein [Saprospiraceae bacterium]